MNFFKRLFGKKTPPAARPAASPASADLTTVSRPLTDAIPVPTDPAKDPNLIRVHDAYGRELFIPKAQWRDSVLLGHLEKIRDQPDELAQSLIQALHDGFAADVLPYVAHLATIDTNTERGQVLHAVTLLDLKRHSEAETILLRFIERHGETGVALTNLAKTYSARGDQIRALSTLWRGLVLDPNQENGLSWYAALHREKDGPAASLDAYRRVAALPTAWRARLWLARDRLGQRDLPAALALYTEALDRAPRPVPADLLQQLSGDLGNHAHLPELLRLTAPHFEVATHGLPVGNNLIKAHLDLGQLDAARAVLDRLYAQNRPDWKQSLSFWDTEIAKALVATADAPAPGKLELTLLTLAGPVWLPPGSPAQELFPAKPTDAPLVTFLGGSAEMPPSAEPNRMHLADAPGHLSRALPLYFAEQVEFATVATTRTLVPWIVKPSSGFVLAGLPWEDSAAAAHARNGDHPADYVVTTHLRCAAEPWAIELRLVRTIDAKCLAETTAPCSLNDPAQALPRLTQTLLAALATQADIAPAPATPGVSPLCPLSSLYLLRLEQLLAVRTAGIEPARSSLSGERDILDGQLQLSLKHPDNVPARLLLAHSLRGLKKVRPDILPEFRPRVDLLQKENPLPEPAQSVVTRILGEAFTT